MKKLVAIWLAISSAFIITDDNFSRYKGAIIRGDTNKKIIAIVFTGHEYAEGGMLILKELEKRNIRASFFFTGDFYRNRDFHDLITQLHHNKHYLGAHSDKHLLYCDWDKRDSLLIDKKVFLKDLSDNYQAMQKFSIEKKSAKYFLPPYEWYNDTISAWTKDFGLQLVNFTPGTLSHADYTTPEMRNYQSSERITQSILSFENKNGLNGFVLLMHVGTHPQRTDKLYDSLGDLLDLLQNKGYKFVRIDTLLK